MWNVWGKLAVKIRITNYSGNWPGRGRGAGRQGDKGTRGPGEEEGSETRRGQGDKGTRGPGDREMGRPGDREMGRPGNGETCPLVPMSPCLSRVCFLD
ncbi:MAG: hypothetical protein F6J93_40185 [Oscillatoria sp. SIO1A7]|nr:hypothetical protein [Oscillatoria sp. SIO1A7]